MTAPNKKNFAIPARGHMNDSSTQMSVADLEKLLSSRKSELNELYRQREKLLSDLDRVSYRIGVLGGTISEDGRSAYFSRPRNAKSLRKHVLQILAENKRGLSLSKLVEKVLEAGYRTSSTNFKNVLYQCLYNAVEIEHDSETGNYKIQASKPKSTTGK